MEPPPSLDALWESAPETGRTFDPKGWCPFTAAQINRADGQLLWRATMHLHGVPITGFDSLVTGAGRTRYKFLGMIPVAGFDHG